jgi:hypothetical protein
VEPGVSSCITQGNNKDDSITNIDFAGGSHLKKLSVILLELILCASSVVSCAAPSNNTGPVTMVEDAGWSSQQYPVMTHYSAVWGISASDVFAVGEFGVIIHYTGRYWSRMDSGTMSNLTSIWGTSPSDVFAVGESGTILHYNGKEWSPMQSKTSGLLGRIWGSSSSDIYAIVNGMGLEHYDGKTWSAMPINIPGDPFLSLISGELLPLIFSSSAATVWSCTTTAMPGAG